MRSNKVGTTGGRSAGLEGGTGAGVLPDGAYQAENRAPEPSPIVHRAALRHRWDEIAFVHWRCEPGAVQRLLPPGLEPDLFEGSAWIGIVPFHASIAPVGFPEVPWISHFPEMNVRTYVRTADGRSGVWFVTLDAARLTAVAIARATYGVNYRWAKMRFARLGDYVLYESRRRSRKSRRPWCRLALEIGEAQTPSQASALDHFLTTRWRFFCSPRGRLAEGFVQHDPWPLHAARLLHLEGDLLRSTGITPSDPDPVCHYSEGVPVRMGWPRRI